MSAVPLTVQNAEVTTASVEIKTLTIRGKQVTQAVFKQLIEEDLIDETEFRGTPWGTVNYHPDRKACPIGEHRHVVWQSGSELRRSTVTKHGEADDVDLSGVVRRHLVSSHEREAFWWNRDPTSDDWGRVHLADKLPSLVSGLFQDGWSIPRYTGRDQSAERRRKRLAGMWCYWIARDAYPELRDPYLLPYDAERAIRECIEMERRYRAEYAGLWAQILDLPQLFIAV